MALSFMPSSTMTLDVVVTCDPAVIATNEQAAAYLESGDLGKLEKHEGATMFTLKALWHHNLSDDEKSALASYQGYINRVFNEMVRASLIMIDERPIAKDSNPLDDIRPEAHRVQVIAELVRHVQRMSLLGQSGK